MTSFDADSQAGYAALRMETSVQAANGVAETIRRGSVSEVKQEGDKTVCCFKDCGSILLSNFLAAHIRSSDEIEFPLAIDSAGVGTELYIHKTSSPTRSRDLYQAPISYATQPKTDKREHLYVRAAVSAGRLGIGTIHLPCEVVRDYFYVARRRQAWERQANLYDTLRISATASPAELRLAFNLRQLELRASSASKLDRATLERAFNILAQPELRACYDSLLKDTSSPALFPYGGFGSILVAGDRSRDGQTFFATRILSFAPEHRERRFRAPLRNFDFHNDHAIYRDVRRRLEVMLDQSAMPITWDATWNQWKHLMGAKFELRGTFVQMGKYRHRRGEGHLMKWETALPSRIEVKLPADIAVQIETARKSYHRFGEFADALAKIRARIEREPLEREHLRSLCWNLGIPGDFDIAQINWQPDYDAFFYRELGKRARRLYLFGSEYILELEHCVVVETPQIGHATYLFSNPLTMEEFFAVYITSTKEDIRQNRCNIAEKLRFLGHIAHGTNPHTWLKELRVRLEEPIDFETGGN
ncbi:MAG: hypothetical protein ABSF71_34050 [Terriglobia bacterium]